MQKMGLCQNIPIRFWASFLQNFNFFHFSWHIIWLVRRVHDFFTDAKSYVRRTSDTLNMFVKSTENFLDALEKNFSPKNGGLSEYSNPTWASFFSKSQLFSLFLTYNLISVSCGLNFLLTQRASLGGPLRYLEHIRKLYGNFLQTLEKKFQTKKWVRNEVQNRIGIFWQTPIFGLNSFFQGPLENFLLALRICSRYLRRLPNLALCVSKKFVTARRTNQITCQEKWKKLRFWKNEAQDHVRIFWQTPICWAETYFKGL